MAIKFENITEGMVLYDVHSTKMGNTNVRRQGVWRVYVESVDSVKRRVVARYNSNTPREYSEVAICRLRRFPPEWMYNHAFRGARFRCEMCHARSDEKTPANHKADCAHPKAVAFRKRQAKAGRP